MNVRTFALTLVTGLLVASGAGAMEYKHQPRFEDRQLSAQSDTYYGHVGHSDVRTGTLDPFNRDPLTSANGS